MSALGIIITILLVALVVYEIISLIKQIKQRKDIKKKAAQKNIEDEKQVPAEIHEKEEVENECNIN